MLYVNYILIKKKSYYFEQVLKILSIIFELL